MAKIDQLKGVLERTTHTVYFSDIKQKIETTAPSKAKATTNAIHRLIPITKMTRSDLLKHYKNNPQYVKVDGK